MLNFKRIGLLSIYRACLIATTLCASLSITRIASGNDLIIVTDIAPVHSLVSMVVGDNANVALLVPPSQSPHSYTLKPSQVSAISKADLVVILSDTFTPSISRHLNSIKKLATVLALSSASHDHDNNNHNNESDLQQSLAQDPHTWLNPNNAIDWLTDIAAAISEVDAANAEMYLRNAEHAKIALSDLQRSLNDQLSGLRDVPYVVYHDAYRHFAYSVGLRDPIPIALSDARAPGAAKLRVIRTEVKQSHCVFSEVLHDDAIVDMVTEGTSVNRGILDPMGSKLPIGPSHYVDTMKAMANSFQLCLEN